MFGPNDTQPLKTGEWRPMRQGGPLHWMCLRKSQGKLEWVPECGGWATDGYTKPSKRGEDPKCRSCLYRTGKRG